MKKPPQRKYSMENRSRQVEEREERIFEAIVDLWLHHSLREITLEEVAARSGVTVRTLLRKYGSKEGLLEASIQKDAAGIQSIKDKAQPGNVQLAVSLLMREYERSGMAGFRTLTLEGELDIAAKVLAQARAMHMAWCERVFSEFLPPQKGKHRSRLLGALYAATDVYKWKLLRIDLGYSKKDTEQILLFTLQAILQSDYRP